MQLLRSELTNKENVLSQSTDDLEIEKSARRGLQQELKKLKEVTPASTVSMSFTAVERRYWSKIDSEHNQCTVFVFLRCGVIWCKFQSFPSECSLAALWQAGTLFGILIIKSAKFQPKYIKDQEKGGKAVVQELLHRVEDYLTTIGIDSKTAIIQIRAYVGAVVPSEANSPQMGSALDPELRQFFGQFNRAHALAEIITFAKGITGVDEKVCGKFSARNDLHALGLGYWRSICFSLRKIEALHRRSEMWAHHPGGFARFAVPKISPGYWYRSGLVRSLDFATRVQWRIYCRYTQLAENPRFKNRVCLGVSGRTFSRGQARFCGPSVRSNCSKSSYRSTASECAANNRQVCADSRFPA